MLKSPGFNYNFNALSGDPENINPENNELIKAVSTIFTAGQKLSAIPVIRAIYPALRFLVHIGIVTSLFYHLILIGLQPAPNDDVIVRGKVIMNCIVTRLLKQIRGDSTSPQKDILSLLAHANTMEKKAHRMTDEDVIGRAYKPILHPCTYSYTLRNPYSHCRWA